MEVGQVSLHRGIDIDFALFNQLHQRQIGKELGNGADAVDRFWTGGNFFVRIGVAKSLCPNNLLIIDQGDRKGRKLLVLHLMLDEFR